MHRPHRRLDGKGDEEADEEQPLDPRADLEPGEVLDEESVGAPRPLQVDRDDGDQHDQPTKQRIQQETRGCLGAARPTEDPDKEVDRDQHRLEEDVKQEDIRSGEDSDHEGFQDQHQCEVALLTPALINGHVFPRRQQTDGDQHDPEQDHRQRNAVDAQGITDPELRDPGLDLRQLELGVGPDLELQGGEYAEHQREQ